MTNNISVAKIVGEGYREFWDNKSRYRVVKGGRGSKKSTTAALSLVYNIMYYYKKYRLKPCGLVIRRYYNTHKSSTYNQLNWAIDRLGVRSLWKSSTSELSLTYKPSGQVIMFRGLDKAESLNSIISPVGHLCWVWWEEAYQITNIDDFNKIDLSIRGELPEHLFKQHTITLNPWSDRHWIKSTFFDVTDDADIFTQTRNYDCNEFLGKDDIAIFEKMKQKFPRRYRVEGLGEWGISEGLIFENWKVEEFRAGELLAIGRLKNNRISRLYGLDFGFTNHPSAFVSLICDETNRIIYIEDEVYGTKLSNKMIFDSITALGCANEVIVADSAEPRTREELRTLGLTGITKSKKGPDSINSGIQKLLSFKIIVHPRCENAVVELSSYTWSKNTNGSLTNKPIDDYNHLIDAMRYATEHVGIDGWSFSG